VAGQVNDADNSFSTYQLMVLPDPQELDLSDTLLSGVS